MGLIITQQDPQITYQNRQIAIACQSSMIGMIFCIAENLGGTWTALFWGAPVQSSSIDAAGGVDAFVRQLADSANAFFATNIKMLEFSVSPSGIAGNDPSSVVTALRNGKMVDKTPAAIIPAQMRRDYDYYFSAAIPVGSSITWSNGSITKLGTALAIYSDPAGVMFSLCPISDLNAIAKSNKHIAAAWQRDYGFVPL